MTEREPWLGHRDLCSLQWSDKCDCDDNPENEGIGPNDGCTDPRGWGAHLTACAECRAGES